MVHSDIEVGLCIFQKQKKRISNCEVPRHRYMNCRRITIHLNNNKKNQLSTEILNDFEFAIQQNYLVDISYHLKGKLFSSKLKSKSLK